MNTSINYCPDCGEYLGDYVNGVLYKFGRVVTESHTCMAKEEGNGKDKEKSR